MSTLGSLQSEVKGERIQPAQQNSNRLRSMILICIWLGVFAGIVEGLDLLLFQRLNLERWGPMVHVSAPIIWIAPIVDSAFFLLVSLFIWLLSRANRRIPGQQLVVALLVFLVVYDWLTVTGRLYRFARIIFALGAAVAS